MSGRGRSLRPGGVVRALLRFFLLVVLGFAAGLLIGVVSEEPELLAGHIRGKSSSVSLSAEADGFAEAEGSVGAEGSVWAEGSVRTEGSADTNEVNSVAGTGSSLAAVAAPPAILPTPTVAPTPVRSAPAVPPTRGTQPARVAEAARFGESKPPAVSASQQVRKPAAAPRDGFAIQVGAFSDERAAQELARGLGQKGYSTSIIPSSESTRRWRVRVQPLADEASAQVMADRLKRDEGLPTWVLRMEPGTESGRGGR